MGARFWIVFVASVIAGGILLAIIFRILGQALLHWGFFGAIILIAAVALGFGWLYDRRQPPRYDAG